MQTQHFYAVIIGTEILNGRRHDAHFEFVKKTLAQFGHTLFASMIIKDDQELIKQTYHLIKNDPKAVMFSFGGIGSTPDDLTREIAADVFTTRPLKRHEKFEADIIERFGEGAYPHRIHMSDLPEGAMLLQNPVNNMSGFYLDNRYFFVPGFPEMAHPMIKNAIETFYAQSMQSFTQTLTAECSENDLIDLMKQLPASIELSSLPQLIHNKPRVAISLSGFDQTEVERYFATFKSYLEAQEIAYTLEDLA